MKHIKKLLLVLCLIAAPASVDGQDVQRKVIQAPARPQIPGKQQWQRPQVQPKQPPVIIYRPYYYGPAHPYPIYQHYQNFYYPAYPAYPVYPVQPYFFFQFRF